MIWFGGTVGEAINKSKTEKKVFVVFINGDDDLSRKMNGMFESLSNQLSGMPLVAIKLEAKSDNCKLFSQIYPVIVIPCTYFIDLNGVAIEIIGGSVDNEKDLMEKIQKVVKIYEKNLSAPDSQQSPVNPSTSEKANSPSSSSEASTSNPVKSVTNNESKHDTSASSSPVSDSLTLQSKVERANQLIEAIREKKAKEEEEKAKNDETERRKGFKEMQKAKKLREDKEAQEAVKERDKEKREEKIARERILAQIAADREERRAQRKVFNSANDKNIDQQQSSSTESSVRERIHDKARIQFRLPDGSTRNHQFGANDTLNMVREYLAQNLSFRDFTLSTTFPRREFTETDYKQSLQQLSLSPSSVLLVIPKKGINSSRAVTSPSLFWQILTSLVTPFLMLWNIITGFFSSSEPSNQTEPTNADSRRDTDKKPKTFYNREGNVARIRDPMRDDDDDDQNTWNGNSTQQM